MRWLSRGELITPINMLFAFCVYIQFHFLFFLVFVLIFIRLSVLYFLSTKMTKLLAVACSRICYSLAFILIYLNFQATADEAGDSLNVALSPFTVWTLLSVIAEGARGSTLKQIDTALGLPMHDEKLRRSIQKLTRNISVKFHELFDN